MRPLPAGLTTAQKSYFVTGAPASPIWKLVLSRAAQTTRGYRFRAYDIDHLEQEFSQTALILLDNSDGALTSLDFEQFKGVLSYGYFTGISRAIWQASTVYSVDDIRTPTATNGFQYRCTTAGTSDSSEPTFPTDLGVTVSEGGGSTVVWTMDGNTGDEYSATAPLYVVDNPLVSGIRGLIVGLTLEGVLNRMGRDRAEAPYTPDETNTLTVKGTIDAIADTTLDNSGPYGNYTAITTSFDSEDSLVDTFQPKDLFRIRKNDTRLDAIRTLLGFTGMKMRVEADGNLHFFDPTTTGTSYDYEYKLLVTGEHTFLNKEVRNRFVDPNKIVVQSHPSHIPQFTGNATSSTSNALYATTLTIEGRFISDAQCDAIAAAKIEQLELDAERGSGKFTMNCGAEVWDWNKITDSRQSDSVTGNVRNIRRRCRIGGQSNALYEMSFDFGKEARGPSAEALLSQIPQMIISNVGTQFDPAAFVTWEFWSQLRLELLEAFQANSFAHSVFGNQMLQLSDAIDFIKQVELADTDEVTHRTARVTDLFIAPVEEA